MLVFDCETLVMQGNIIFTGQITTSCYVSIPQVVRNTLKEIGFDNAKDGLDCETCGMFNFFYTEQFPDIAVRWKMNPQITNKAPVDQGMVFGYASNETEELDSLAHNAFTQS